MPALKPPSWRWAAATFSVVLGALLALGWPSLSWPMAFDDLHLMRRFTGGQILASFHGQWDPERLMTRGLRPLSLLFNHVRTSVFGENVVAHRLLVMVLLAAYWALLVPVARRVGTGPAAVIVAGVLFLCSPYSVFHYVWITDGNHALQGLAFAASAWLLCRGLERSTTRALAGSLLSLLAGLLVREDTLAALPALLLVGGVAAPSPEARRRLVGYALAALALCAGLLAYRGRVVGKVMAPGHDLLGLLQHARRMLQPAGTMTFDGPSTILVTAASVLAAATAVAFFVLVPPARWRAVLAWLAAGFFACAPGLNVQRDDLLLFPVSFMSLALATAWAEVVRGRPRVIPQVAAALAITVAGGAYVSRVFAENFHPQSLRVVWWNGRYLYGAYSERATMPPERRDAALEHLASLGIHNLRHHLRRTGKLVEDAVAEHRRRPPADGRPFYPLLPWDED